MVKLSSFFVYNNNSSIILIFIYENDFNSGYKTKILFMPLILYFLNFKYLYVHKCYTYLLITFFLWNRYPTIILFPVILPLIKKWK